MATKKCAFCAEEIQEEAVKCKHCQSSLTDKTGLPAAIKAAKSPAKLSIVLFASSLLLGIGFILGRSTFVHSHMPVTGATQPATQTGLTDEQAQILSTASTGYARYLNDGSGRSHPSAAILGAHLPSKAVEYYRAFLARDEAKLQELAQATQDFDPLTVDDELGTLDNGTVEDIRILKVDVKTGAQVGKTLFIALPLLKPGAF